MTVITLLTDFGIRDGYPGVMKGVIWNIAPDVQIVDLSHEISPQDVLEAALLLRRSAPFFPNGTIHIAVVDPGVGTSRRGLACRIGAQYFVGPDNGLFTLIVAEAESEHLPVHFIHLNQPAFWLPEVSKTFHGRDIFAPVAAHLAIGTPLDSLGSAIDDPIRLDLPAPAPTSAGWQGEVIYIDHFGNLSTNLNASHINTLKDLVLRIHQKQIVGMASTFGDRPRGTLVALLDSSGALVISVVNGNAAKVLQAHLGDKVEVSSGGDV